MALRILPAGQIPSGVLVTLDDATLSDVADSLGELPEAGHMEFDFELAYDTAADRITRVNLTMRMTIDLPVWTRVGSRPAAEQQEWQRFLRAMRVHEDGHADICRSEVNTTYERLQQATPSTIDDVLEAERQRIIRLNELYDHRTGSGTTQQTPHGSTEIRIP